MSHRTFKAAEHEMQIFNIVVTQLMRNRMVKRSKVTVLLGDVLYQEI